MDITDSANKKCSAGTSFKNTNIEGDDITAMQMYSTAENKFAGFKLWTNKGKMHSNLPKLESSLKPSEPYEGKGVFRIVGGASNKISKLDKNGNNLGTLSYFEWVIASNPVWSGKKTADAVKIKKNLSKPKSYCGGPDMECLYGYILDGGLACMQCA